MPQSTLSGPRVMELLRVPLSPSALEDLLFASKAEIDQWTEEEWTISVTPDRLDLLSEGGLALYLQGAIGSEGGLPRPLPYPVHDAGLRIEVDPSVDPLRPAIAGAVVRAPEGSGLDVGLLAESVRFQEILHATMGRDRRSASLGIYPLERLTPPVRYSLESFDSIRFVPLDGMSEVGGTDFFRDHPMAARYGPLGRSQHRALVLRDSHGTILSLPPVLNGRAAGEARSGDRTLLLESTGTSERSVRESLGLLLVPFVAQGWAVGPVPIVGPGELRADGRQIIDPHSVDVRASLIEATAGTKLQGGEVERRLSSARLGFHPHSGGWKVDAPPWRPDLVTPIDVVEDIILIVGVRPEDGLLPWSGTRGRRLPEVLFRRRVATWLLGLGFVQPNTPFLLSETSVARVDATGPIRVRNPVSAEFAFVRDRLLPAHLEVLQRNTRHAYPQRFAEVGPVVHRSPESEPGAVTCYHAGAVIASENAGFADVAALVDYLLRNLDVGAVREPAELAASLPGRAARVRVAGEVVAELGEVHPRLLEQLGVPVPVAWAEVGLSVLWPLLVGHEGH
ncbi:MAG TPA: hypothetical protein VEH57_05400 [Thermoplasmata archaeon]|nr:hypothetical protein [Thermoplasmata archaeon]